MRRIFLGMTAIALCSSAALAADLFTVNVPVEVSHLNPMITSISVSCRVADSDMMPTSGLPSIVATKSKTLQLMNGGFNGTATIVFTTDDFKPQDVPDLDRVHYGTCTLRLVGRGGVATIPSANSDDPAHKPQPGTPFAAFVSFKIP